MAVISVVSHCPETAVQLETALRGHGHMVRTVPDYRASDPGPDGTAGETGLFVVDVDCGPADAAYQLRSIGEDPHTALKPVLVACSAESEQELAMACAYGATGLLRKPFKTMETVPDTERALAAAHPAS